MDAAYLSITGLVRGRFPNFLMTGLLMTGRVCVCVCSRIEEEGIWQSNSGFLMNSLEALDVQGSGCASAAAA